MTIFYGRRGPPCVPPEGRHLSVKAINGAVLLSMPVTAPGGTHLLTGTLEVPRSEIGYLLERIEQAAFESDQWAALYPDKDTRRPRTHPLLLPPPEPDPPA